MVRNAAFTITEMCTAVASVVIILILANAMTGCGPSAKEKNRLQMLNSTHLRGIHSGMVLFGQGNKDFYPGLDSNGDEATHSGGGDPLVSTKATGSDPAYRYARLINGNYFSPVYAVSPMDEKTKTLAKKGDVLTTNHFSYSMLRINDKSAAGRLAEWKATNNSRAAAISDRNVGSGAGASAASNFKELLGSKTWTGSVCFNDNHVQQETTNVIKTEYSQKGENAADDLFADDGGNDAAMVYQDATSYVNQK